MTTIDGIIEFYRRSNADTLEALDGEGKGVIWTLPPCSPEGLKQGIRQLIRCKATRIRWTRKLCLQSGSEGQIEAIGVYLLPKMEQNVYRVDSGLEIVVGLLRDDCTIAASMALSGSAE